MGPTSSRAIEAGPDGRINVLAVFPHPDDESFYCGGSLIRLAKDSRISLHLLCLTDGSADEAGARLGLGPERLAAIRRRELELAAEVIGFRDLDCWGFRDGGAFRPRPGSPSRTDSRGYRKLWRRRRDRQRSLRHLRPSRSHRGEPRDHLGLRALEGSGALLRHPRGLALPLQSPLCPLAGWRGEVAAPLIASISRPSSR